MVSIDRWSLRQVLLYTYVFIAVHFIIIICLCRCNVLSCANMLQQSSVRMYVLYVLFLALQLPGMLCLEMENFCNFKCTPKWTKMLES